MFVNMSPLPESLQETLCSLRFATKVCMVIICTNPPSHHFLIIGQSMQHWHCKKDSKIRNTLHTYFHILCVQLSYFVSACTTLIYYSIVHAKYWCYEIIHILCVPSCAIANYMYIPRPSCENVSVIWIIPHDLLQGLTRGSGSQIYNVM